MRVPRIDEVIRPVANATSPPDREQYAHSVRLENYVKLADRDDADAPPSPGPSIKPAPFIAHRSRIPVLFTPAQPLSTIRIDPPLLFWYNGTGWLTGHQLALSRLYGYWFDDCMRAR